jgi:signal transduction histidine kinase
MNDCPDQPRDTAKRLATSGMKRSLNTYVLLVFSLVLAGALSVGGASLLMVHRMMDKTHAIAQESLNVDFINHLHNKTYSLVLTIHHLMVKNDERFRQSAVEQAEEIDRDLRDYLIREEASPHPESTEEIRLLKALRQNLASLNMTAIHDAELQAITFEAWEKLLEQHTQEMQSQLREINRLHFEIIARKVDKTRHSMTVVFYLYALFLLVSLALFYLGYRLHARHIVRPLTQLARAAGRVADGNLDTRVAVVSGTEIGVLYGSFNTMVDRLRDHEQQLQNFNRELEAKVHERTHDLERAYASLQQAQNELVHFEKMALLGQVATTVNHEIRTPLNTLYMNLQLVRKSFEACIGDCKDKDVVARRIDVIDREVLRISDMLEEFVRYARLTPPKMSTVAIHKLVHSVAEMLSERFAQGHVALKLSLANAPCMVRADESKLVQVLVNLCINAIHAMPDGGVLTLQCVESDGKVEISVADTGLGIPEQNLDKVFEPFFTSKASGLGFGLSIVKRIVQDHGGQIICRSKVGEGSLFTLTLPTSNPFDQDTENECLTADCR